MQTNQLVCLGLSHHTARLELREYFNGLALSGHHDPRIREMALVSTCNRMELYAYLDATVTDGHQVLIDLLAGVHRLPPALFANHTYFHTGEAVVNHLCRVAAGLESMVIGEAQILGQVSQALQAAQEAKRIGSALSLLFRTAIRVGKRARTETAISVNPASTSSVAVTLAQTAAGDLRHQRVLVIGMGEIGELTLKALRARGVTGIDVANRTRIKAEVAVAPWHGTAYTLNELPQALADADVVISATSAQQPLINAAMVKMVMAQRPQRQLVLVDLAVPRDIDPAVAALPNVQLFDIDDLRAGLDEALSARQREIPQVEAIITQEVGAWRREFQSRVLNPVVAELRQKAEAIRQRELGRALNRLGNVDPAVADQLQHLSRALVNQLLHEPTVRLKQKAGSDDGAEYAQAIRELFGLEDVKVEF